MSSLGQELERSYGIGTVCLPLDLARKDAPKVMMDAVSGLDCRLLVYNAAYSIVQPFVKNTPQDLDHYIDVNARTLIQTVLHFTEKCRAAGGSSIAPVCKVSVKALSEANGVRNS